MDDLKWMSYSDDDLVRINSGFKVGWRIYASEEAAKLCAVAAENNAIIKAYKGFDFGYQYPSEIRKVDDGWCVTIP